MRGVFWDVRYAARQMLKNPAFALAAVISLALGIGSATAVFSVIYAALIHPYPYRDAERILRLTVDTPTRQHDWAPLDAAQIRQLKQNPAVEDVIVMDGWSLPLTGGDFPEDVETIFLSSNGFDFLGDPMLMGRGLVPADAVDGQQPQPVAVLSYKFWLRHFFGSADVVGKSLELNHKRYRIVGVAEPRFTWYSADVYLPLDLARDPISRYLVNLRLKPGITPKAGSAALQPLLHQFAHDEPKQFSEKFEVALEDLNAWVRRDMGHQLYLLLGAVGLLLAIGCGNVSILLLARGSARAHELAVRSAIGAGRGRIVQQLLTESLLLAMAGAAMGVASAYGAVAAMKMVLPQYEFAPEVVVAINVPVLCFCVGAALVTGLLFGLSPALQLSRAEPERVLQAGRRSVAGSGRARRTHQALIAGQIALTLMLLAGAGAAIEGFIHLMRAPLGYEPHNAMSVWVPLEQNSYPVWAGRVAYFDKLRAAVNAVPGVTAAAIATNSTPPYSGMRTKMEILGKPSVSEQEVRLEMVGAEYFSLLRIPLVQGRMWTAAENRTGSRIVVVNHAFAKTYFPGGDALGHALKLPAAENRPPIFLTVPGLAEDWLQIVGVVGDSRNVGLRDPAEPAVYVPNSLVMPPGTQILVRSQSNPMRLVNAIRIALAKVNPNQQAARVVSDLDKWISDQTEWQQKHLVAWLFGAFAVLALSLASVGLYSVVSYAVAQRTNEFGIRMALGAQRGHVMRIVLASMMASVGAGVAVGALLTVALNRILSAWVGSEARDPLLVAVGAVVLCAVAVLACIVPARRAALVDPMNALRAE